MAQRKIPNHQACRENASRFLVLLVDSRVTDMGIGQGNDLAAIRRIGEDFLVTGHRGIKYHFPSRDSGSAN